MSSSNTSAIKLLAAPRTETPSCVISWEVGYVGIAADHVERA